MLDYKSIIIKRYALGLSYKELAEEFSASKSGINDFIRAFERCEKLSYPLPEGITNYASEKEDLCTKMLHVMTYKKS